MQKIIPHLWFDTEAIEAASQGVSKHPDCAGLRGIKLVEKLAST